MNLAFICLMGYGVLGSSCNGNCPGNDCAICTCGTVKNPQDIEYWCSLYTWDQDMCQCIVSHESEGNGNALNYNPSDDTYDIGLFQINTINWRYNSGVPPCNVTQNLQCAIEVYKDGNNTFKLWTTYQICIGTTQVFKMLIIILSIS